jgi:hypothetical protein
VQDHRELACERHARLAHPRPLRDGECPVLQARGTLNPV